MNNKKLAIVLMPMTIDTIVKLLEVLSETEVTHLVVEHIMGTVWDKPMYDVYDKNGGKKVMSLEEVMEFAEMLSEEDLPVTAKKVIFPFS